MSNLTRVFRLWVYAALISMVAAVLGLAAHFVKLFLPHIHRDYVLFIIIIPCITLVFFFALLLRSQPRVEAVCLFILSSLWLTAGSYSTDVIGHVECYALIGQTVPINGGKTMPANTWCYEMKAIEALSWATFAVLALSFFTLIALATRSQALGRAYIWRESISDLPWFGQWNQLYMNYGPAGPMYPGGQMQGGYMPQPGGGYVVHQQPGHSIVVDRSRPGAPQITQVPGTVIQA